MVSLAFRPDGRRLASAARDNVIRLHDTAGVAPPAAPSPADRLPGGQLLATLRGHTGPVNAVANSPDGRTLASAGEDGLVLVWDLPAAPASQPR